MSDDRQFQKGDLLLIIDAQKDFFPGGKLPIGSGDLILPVVNSWIRNAVDAGVPIIATRDWHPKGHPSFETEGGQWPVHCVQDSDGAMFHDDLLLPADVIISSKGTRFDKDQYSDFDETGMEVYLKKRGIQRIFMCGLALDVCVHATAMDARELGFDVMLIADGTRPVSKEGGEKALKEMKSAGVTVVESDGLRRPDGMSGQGDEDVCVKAPEWAEHQRLSDMDEPCDDGRSGKI